jgi:[ribosomal protein S5]-alanine N-acetyltransferase
MTPRQPNIETARLLLRPMRMADADVVQRLAGDRAIADMTLNIPYPYEDGLAEKWISNHRDWFENREQVVFAITPLNQSALLLGAVGLLAEPDDQRAELGYWIGVPHWGQGYATEAARAVVAFGFESWQLHRITANCFLRNPASARVMQKIGMTHEGHLRQHVKKWDAFEDIEIFGILVEEWRRAAE